MRYIIFSLVIIFTSCKSNSQNIGNDSHNADKYIETTQSEGQEEFVPLIIKTSEEWREQLTEQEFYVLRESGTERAFTGDLLKNNKEGIYTCAACDNKIFSSKTKFKSGTGWPSYYEYYNEKSIHSDTDYKIGYARTEISCQRCGGHLGHVFSDGPQPTGQRYCINSVAMNFVETK